MIRRGVHETARMTGISPSHVSKIIKGTRRPSIDTLRLLAQAWDASTDEVLHFLRTVRQKRSSKRAAQQVA